MPQLDPITRLQRSIMDGGAKMFDVVPTTLARVIKDRAWEGRCDINGQPFRSFEAFAQHRLWEGLNCSVDDLLAFCRKKPDVQQLVKSEIDPAATREEAGAKGGRGNKAADNVNSFGGNSSTYALKRLKRDRPDLAELVIAGKLSANQAAIEAGFRKKLSRFDQIIKWLPDLTPDQHRQLVQQLKELLS